MEKINERELSYEILLRVIKKNEFLNAATMDVLGKVDISHSQKAVVLRCVNGSVEKMTELDFIIDTFSNTPVRKQKKEIHVLLLMGVYQLKYMDSIPAHAAINETVKLACAHHFSSLRGFINGVLRSIDRALHDENSSDYDKLRKKINSLDKTKRLSIDYAMPVWIVEHLVKSYGVDIATNMLEGLAKDRGTVIRLTTSAGTAQEYIENNITWASENGVKIRTVSDNAIEVRGVSGIDTAPGFNEGKLYVQDMSAMETIEALFDGFERDFRESIAVDVCAAPGGKSLYAAELMKAGSIISRDLTPNKVDLIKDNVSRLGLLNITPQVWDATNQDKSLINKCDIVIADLPCSGLGVINKKPDIRHRVAIDDLSELQQLQRQILEAVVPYLKTGGRLLYSTCTLDPKENEENTEFLQQNWPDLTLISDRTIIPDELHDGFYYAVFEKRKQWTLDH